MKTIRFTGRTTLEILVFLMVAVFTSAAVLFLVQAGVLSVRASGEDVPLLDTEFVPVAREGHLVVKEFQFCSYVDDHYDCLLPRDGYAQGEEVFFRYVVESSAHDGQVMIIKNYRLIEPDGVVVLEADEHSNVPVEVTVDDKREIVTFKDSFVIGSAAPPGRYTLILLLENPLAAKSVKVREQFTVKAS